MRKILIGIGVLSVAFAIGLIGSRSGRPVIIEVSNGTEKSLWISSPQRFDQHYVQQPYRVPPHGKTLISLHPPSTDDSMKMELFGSVLNFGGNQIGNPKEVEATLPLTGEALLRSRSEGAFIVKIRQQGKHLSLESDGYAAD